MTGQMPESVSSWKTAHQQLKCTHLLHSAWIAGEFLGFAWNWTRADSCHSVIIFLMIWQMPESVSSWKIALSNLSALICYILLGLLGSFHVFNVSYNQSKAIDCRSCKQKNLTSCKAWLWALWLVYSSTSPSNSDNLFLLKGNCNRTLLMTPILVSFNLWNPSQLQFFIFTIPFKCSYDNDYDFDLVISENHLKKYYFDRIQNRCFSWPISYNSNCSF